MKRTFAGEDFERAQDAILDGETIETESWRHGTRQLIVFELDGAHWMCSFDVHRDDGIQFYGKSIEAVKVHKVQRVTTTMVWEPIE